MKQSTSRKNRDLTAFLYVRLSRDDNLEGESYSISNQKKLLTKVAKEKGYTNLVVFCDDGVSGVTMNRPGFNAMVEELEKGHATAVFVKDMSRLGRNYIEVGRLTEEYFPEHEIRLVAISDGVDSDEGENELTPIRNLFNEWYARDISKKRRISNRIKGNAGEPLGQPPYGYMKDPDKPKHWIIDANAAKVVRRIFSMALEGQGSEQIAAALAKDRVLTPMHYWRSIGLIRPGKPLCDVPYRWQSSTIIKILSKQEYCGDIVNFKTYSKSFKNKTRYDSDPEDIVIFRDVHEPIIDRTSWERVQQKRDKIRKRKNMDGEHNMFSGILVCAECGHNLNYHFSQSNPEIKYFNCQNYKGNRGTCSATHYIRVDFLEKVVLGEIRRLTRFASRYEDEFVQAVIGQSRKTVDREQTYRKKELAALLARDKELDVLFEHLYEDNVSGKINDERFHRMSRRYEDEQVELQGKVKTLQKAIDQSEASDVSTDVFIATVRKYTRARKLTPRMLNELVHHIEVYHAEKVESVHVQKLTIHYNCIGTIDVPDIPYLAPQKVQIQTRKGVAVSNVVG
jgi:DNA invertase Pin-like site-specific DNA recombinase